MLFVFILCCERTLSCCVSMQIRVNIDVENIELSQIVTVSSHEHEAIMFEWETWNNGVKSKLIV